MSTPQPQALPSEPKVWLSLTQAQLDWAYDQANHAPNRVDVLKRIAQKSALSRAKVPQALRLSYGQSPIESLDWYLSEEANAPIVFLCMGALGNRAQPKTMPCKCTGSMPWVAMW